MSDLLRTDSLTKRFGGLTAVDSVDFAIDDGECCSLIGPNGAGKTTFFNLLTGALQPTAGRVEFHDDEWHDITAASPHETALRGIHRSYQITNIFPQSTVLENVCVAAQAPGGADSWKVWRNVGAFDAYEREALDILERVGLAAEAHSTAGTLSHGQKRNLEVAIALAGDPDLLLLDEPTAGVSSDGIRSIVELIRNVASDHAILLVEHNMEVVMNVSERILVLHQGELIADGAPAEVRDDPAVQEAYLGGYEPDRRSGDDGASDESTSGGGVA